MAVDGDDPIYSPEATSTADLIPHKPEHKRVISSDIAEAQYAEHTRMAFHYGGGGLSMAAINIANPRNEWIAPDPEEASTGKQVLKAAAAGIKKSGKEIARTPSRLGSLRRRSTTLDGETRPASRLSMFMERLNVGTTKEEAEDPHSSKRSREGEEKNTPTKKLKNAYASFRQSRARRAVTAPIAMPLPTTLARSDDIASLASTTIPGSEDGYSLCRVRAITHHHPRPTSLAPSLPLLSFPSMIAMPQRPPSVSSSYASYDRDAYSGEEENVREAVEVVHVGRARLVSIGC